MSDPLPKPDYLGAPIGYKVLCPYCSEEHTVNPYISPPQPTMPEPENTRQWASCPTRGQDFLVGMGGYLFLGQDPLFEPVA